MHTKRGFAPAWKPPWKGFLSNVKCGFEIQHTLCSAIGHTAHFMTWPWHETVEPCLREHFAFSWCALMSRHMNKMCPNIYLQSFQTQRPYGFSNNLHLDLILPQSDYFSKWKNGEHAGQKQAKFKNHGAGRFVFKTTRTAQEWSKKFK